jgi:short-subunit dehydrogenase involved in D-alanine esterification of teichoic acids
MCGLCLVFASYTRTLDFFALQLRKKHQKTSVRVVETCPDISVAVVQYTFTHKQYTEQHNNTQNSF